MMIFASVQKINKKKIAPKVDTYTLSENVVHRSKIDTYKSQLYYENNYLFYIPTSRILDKIA